MPTRRTADFLGVPIDFVSPREALHEIVGWRRVGKRGYITLVNPHSVLACSRDAHMRSAILNSDLVVPDGVGITIAARLLGYGPTQRVPGPCLILEICDSGRVHGLRHFFYGGGEGVAATLARRLAERFPHLEICGLLSPPFCDLTPEQNTAIVHRINAAQPDLVWVGLGTGKQEKWMHTHVGHLRASALIGVGAAFDFHAGTVPWAPAWVRRAGFEWLYRLAHEPRRLWRRNLDGPVFLARIVNQRLLRNPVTP